MKELILYSLVMDRVRISFLNLGCAITEISIPDKHGIMGNIVLAYNDLFDYYDNSSYQGCIIGRNAGRIANAEFSIDGEIYKLEKNDGNNNLHGGIKGFNRKIWDSITYENENSIGVRFYYKSIDGEEGYPGNVDIIIDYCLNSDSTFNITMKANSDKKTLINLTNHTYYNLSDFKDSILNHDIYIDSTSFCELDEGILPTGKIISDGTFNFKTPHTLLEEVNKKSEHLIQGGIDHPMILGDEKCAILSYPSNGRRLKISSNQPVVVVYTGNALEKEEIFNDNMRGCKHLGICFEMQDYPNNINLDTLPTKLYGESDTYINEIKLEFN